MAELSFESLRFEEKHNTVRVIFMGCFYFELKKIQIEKIGEFNLSERVIEFPGVSHDKALRKFMFLVDKGLNELRSISTGNRAVYVHRNSGIPLIGTGYMGIVDRNTNLIEIKPQTGCNLNCIFCSVGEGITSKKNDFVVEKDYLVEELRKLIEFKGEDDIEVHVGTNGEPLLYEPLVDLVRDVSKIDGVKRISMDTNGTLLTREKVDALVDAGMTGFNISINALEERKAKKLAGVNFDFYKQMEIAEYIASLDVRLNIAPIWVPGHNDEQMRKLAGFVQRLGNAWLAIQNFLEYKGGRRPARQKPWDKFYSELREMEKEFGMKFVYTAEDFGVYHTKKLPKPFKKNDVVRVKIVSIGRDEMLGVAEDRVVSVIGDYKIGSRVNVRILRDKHNIFLAK